MAKHEAKKVTQAQMIYKHLRKSKTITPLVAWTQYGCYRLSSVINRLRKNGHDITTTIKKQGSSSWAVYKLSK
jgi:DNA polymerase III delta subunit